MPQYRFKVAFIKDGKLKYDEWVRNLLNDEAARGAFNQYKQDMNVGSDTDHLCSMTREK